VEKGPPHHQTQLVLQAESERQPVVGNVGTSQQLNAVAIHQSNECQTALEVGMGSRLQRRVGRGSKGPHRTPISRRVRIAAMSSAQTVVGQTDRLDHRSRNKPRPSFREVSRECAARAVVVGLREKATQPALARIATPHDLRFLARAAIPYTQHVLDRSLSGVGGFAHSDAPGHVSDEICALLSNAFCDCEVDVARKPVLHLDRPGSAGDQRIDDARRLFRCGDDDGVLLAGSWSAEHRARWHYPWPDDRARAFGGVPAADGPALRVSSTCRGLR
jgi:hypothetical protein